MKLSRPLEWLISQQPRLIPKSKTITMIDLPPVPGVDEQGPREIQMESGKVQVIRVRLRREGGGND